ncbi:hypothetical protein SMACR_01840 [Sordaria macrospora]|uniref:WGS project CABT00000000 data, contig 2.5 n=2 Tax=Sordaria macrospora TaxID=5147 RepID=F7VS06_SORMK|nr:uncharacterized protein SMAC_01840 [Sordaria macrospora k-hell]KAA8636535.1 hypothetical protein SMACR_01840 [Sordaria macrospora]WPJ61533.1 hypothetical protein SMAC4_01840 [Sordaria macrospora]CCC08292.1 unnamed protein product [Sordaria macrospora k-hell]
MHPGSIETPVSVPRDPNLISSDQAAQHGSPRSQPSSPDDASPHESIFGGDVASGSDDGHRFDQDFGRLRAADYVSAAQPVMTAGQRIAEYENALLLSRQHVPHTLAFQVVKNTSNSPGRVKLTDFPNEILTHILSHLHPDSHGDVALVSKRFYHLVAAPYAWRRAFLRNFPGQESLLSAKKRSELANEDGEVDRIRSESRYFARLSAMATWRSEYLLRTRLLRSVSRGKPDGSSQMTIQSGKKAAAVLTDIGMASVSDPTTGKIEKLGMDDQFHFQQLDEVHPGLVYYGMGDGPAAVPNVIDVSQPYGLIGAEAFPGGRVYFKPQGQLRGRFLGIVPETVDGEPEIPKIPVLLDAVCSVWIAKSPNVPTATDSMVGMLTGSTLGIVTAYTLGYEISGRRAGNRVGEITARWVLSPGVPIVDIKVDDNYNLRRKGMDRVWAVALNALGEVFYLIQTPTPSSARGKSTTLLKDAWDAGRTAYWEMIEATRRVAIPDDFDKNAADASYSPRTSANFMNLSKPQIVAEAREIESFFRRKPADFRKACLDWDMQRILEVDFAVGDENGGEAIFKIECGLEEGVPPTVRRYVRHKASPVVDSERVAALLSSAPTASIFGATETPKSLDSVPQSTTDGGEKPTAIYASSGSPSTSATPAGDVINGWSVTDYKLKMPLGAEITASAIDLSNYAVMAAFEDPLCFEHDGSGATSKEIPGRRARYLAVGTSTGSVNVWNMRDHHSAHMVKPLRVIQTDSPAISSLALSALYLLHGGTDGVVQAWDPLASTNEPIRTLNAKMLGRIPRAILSQAPAMERNVYSAVRAIFLDPDPTVLRGVSAWGNNIRFWSYSSTNQTPGRKRRHRHNDVHGRVASRRTSHHVSGFIAAEEAELIQEEETRTREMARLRSRFGQGLADMTEEEALLYAQLVSEEDFIKQESLRLAAEAEMRSTAESEWEQLPSTGSSADQFTPESSLPGASPSVAGSGANLPTVTEESEEEMIQRAIRLSLLESNGGVDDAAAVAPGPAPELAAEEAEQYPPRSPSPLPEFSIIVKPLKGKGKGKQPCAATGSSSSLFSEPGYTNGSAAFGLDPVDIAYDTVPTAVATADAAEFGGDIDDDLALALRLSLEEEQARQSRMAHQSDMDMTSDVRHVLENSEEFPRLDVKGKGKGRMI